MGGIHNVSIQGPPNITSLKDSVFSNTYSSAEQKQRTEEGRLKHCKHLFLV